MMKALSHRKQQKGAVLVLVTIALFTLLGFTALALDGGYLLLNKTRVQDAVDSAALSGAKTLTKKPADGNTHDDARDAVLNTLQTVFAGDGFSQVNIDTNNLAAAVTVQFSEEVVPFISTTDEAARFIRVRLDTVPVTQFFSQLLVDSWQVSSSAVAGPEVGSNTEDNKVIPLLLCAKDPDDIEGDGSFGFNESTETEQGDVIVIKTNHHKKAPVGGGNFLGLALEGTGANVFRNALAGDLTDKSIVVVGQDVTTEPGNMTGPALGLNTRLNEFNSPLSAPDEQPTMAGSEAFYPDCKQPAPDSLTFDNEDFGFGDPGLPGSGNVSLQDGDADGDGINEKEHLQSYPEYFSGTDTVDINSSTDGKCIDDRRIVKVPVGNCDPGCNGRCDIPVVGVACMFLNQKVTGNGSSQYIVAEKIAGCGLGGSNPGASNSFKLVLYKDSNNGDS
ncbi:pilus assembly protein [Oceanisphaera sediminis]|uniref:Pilus assembly protein n=1 Tax=Oceanisphaera sediminis TaxID=981381 RepID=A0ABP7EPX5_9GAMM